MCGSRFVIYVIIGNWGCYAPRDRAWWPRQSPPSPLASRLLSQDLAHGRPGQAIGRDALHSHSNSAIISSDSEEKLLTVLFDFSTDRDDLWYLGELWPATAREDTIASLIGTRLRARGARALSQSTCHIRGVYTNRVFYRSYHADNYM